MRFSFRFILAASCFSLALSSTLALAQLEQQTGIADPGQVQDRLREDMVIPSSIPNVEVKQMALQGIPEGAEDITLTLRDVRLEGTSIYDAGVLEDIYAPSIGENITLADVYRIANTITLKYRNKIPQ
jgi:hemolysin activation/secretion protein